MMREGFPNKFLQNPAMLLNSTLGFKIRKSKLDEDILLSYCCFYHLGIFECQLQTGWIVQMRVILRNTRTSKKGYYQGTGVSK